jgi:hypothetical protein
MSDAGPGPSPLPRPRWLLPVAVLGALLILLGIVLAIDWSGGGNGDQPARVTGTTVVVGSGG